MNLDPTIFNCLGLPPRSERLSLMIVGYQLGLLSYRRPAQYSGRRLA